MNQCITPIPNAEIGAGFTGVLHHAKMEVSMSENRISSHDIVVKLVFSSEQRDRISHGIFSYGIFGCTGVHSRCTRSL